MNLATLTARQSARPPVACTVSKAPATASARLDVEWDAETYEDGPQETRTEQGVRWTCKPGKWPAVGDDATLVLDSQGDGWAIVQATGSAPAAASGVARGSGTVTFATANNSVALSVPHSLGVTPASVQLTATSGVGVTYGLISKTSSQFEVVGFFAPSPLSGSFTFDWVAYA